jgi:hypothetical protein
MAKLYNLARVTTATTGTGTITLGAAVSGYLTFAQAGVANGETVAYGIKDGANSEVGTGVYTSSGTTLARTVTKSTNSDAAINLSGTAEVFITPRKEDLLSTSETQSANLVFAGPASGGAAAPGFRSLVSADIPAKFGQVVQTIDATARSTTSSSPTNTGVSVTITPTSASSKILILVTTSASQNNANSSSYLGLKRGSTQITTGATGNAFARGYLFGVGQGGTGAQTTPVTFHYLDSPATTSAVSYNLYFSTDANVAGDNVTINGRASDSQNFGATVMTAIEILP